MSGAPVRCVDVRHAYPAPGGTVTALAGVDLTVPAGGRLAVLGPSGSGKSTLLTLLAGLHRPTAGQIWVGDDDLATAPQRRLLALRGGPIATVVQGPTRNLLPYVSAGQNIRFAQRTTAREHRSELPEPADLLARLGLADHERRPVAGMSGGEQQRLAIAVGLARAPALLLLDEPTSQLDSASRDRVIELIEGAVAEAGGTVVTVTHDPAVARAMGRTVVMRAGTIVGGDR